MGQNTELQPAPVERLSVELVRMILSDLPDVSSLQAAALSCPLFYKAFSGAENTITTQVLLRNIDKSLLPEVLLAFKSSGLHWRRMRDNRRQAVADFITQNLHQRTVLPPSWPLRKAIHFERLNFCVKELTEMFIQATLTRNPINQSKAAATCQETHRIQRAFYRFEIYRNLFSERPKPYYDTPGEESPLFFASFSPWENEQLGCVHDFLVQAVSPAFNDVAEHDVAWGAFNVNYGDLIDSPYIQHVLSLGLEELHRITLASTYEERYRLLNTPSGPPATNGFLQDALETANNANEDLFLDRLTPEQEALHIKKPFFADPDSGPRDVWLWAHKVESWANWVYQENRRQLRQWGYVMWDKSRLETAGVLQEPWYDPTGTPEWLLQEEEAVRQRGYMQNSWEKRERIRMKGGSGWWSWGDESKVKWPKNIFFPGQGRSVPGNIKPASLREARELLSMMKLPK
ncbi:zinc finger domain-containing protein [Pochonia chlamydosporia 170]|uniref:Zinc finger domain-containing protein n=1 Tax=Pochonia chlamydosporia 170 TaxID=1380566 RepID=A0A179F6W0_METCM|nr:zinc finger domain-containing protein [Pochonia chlamydosporia 170]OAQ61137.1 zinc finger domain-containing protein [Pochonia chlamydosporia 170]